MFKHMDFELFKTKIIENTHLLNNYLKKYNFEERNYDDLIPTLMFNFGDYYDYNINKTILLVRYKNEVKDMIEKHKYNNQKERFKRNKEKYGFGYHNYDKIYDIDLIMNEFDNINEMFEYCEMDCYTNGIKNQVIDWIIRNTVNDETIDIILNNRVIKEYISIRPKKNGNVDNIVDFYHCYWYPNDWVGLLQMCCNIPNYKNFKSKDGWWIINSYNYTKMRERNKNFCEELVKKVFHPERIQRICDAYNMDMTQYLDLI